MPGDDRLGQNDVGTFQGSSGDAAHTVSFRFSHIAWGISGYAHLYGGAASSTVLIQEL